MKRKKIKPIVPLRTLNDNEELDWNSVHPIMLHNTNSISKVEVLDKQVKGIFYMYRLNDRVYIDYTVQEDGRAKCCQACHQLVRNRIIVKPEQVKIYARSNY